jgi:hypothetical protein
LTIKGEFVAQIVVTGDNAKCSGEYYVVNEGKQFSDQDYTILKSIIEYVNLQYGLLKFFQDSLIYEIQG